MEEMELRCSGSRRGKHLLGVQTSNSHTFSRRRTRTARQQFRAPSNHLRFKTEERPLSRPPRTNHSLARTARRTNQLGGNYQQPIGGRRRGAGRRGRARTRSREQGLGSAAVCGCEVPVNSCWPSKSPRSRCRLRLPSPCSSPGLSTTGLYSGEKRGWDEGWAGQGPSLGLGSAVSWGAPGTRVGPGVGICPPRCPL